ncbi:SEC14-like protein 2 [Ixodes scapularis]|uniref:SEC14-like protein 2 n=1 Tax=Ixodes scapularis TaxID=6945 RepID=UPI001C3858C4|nr:SEC14-like protein 2 [Ixodes scapularis]
MSGYLEDLSDRQRAALDRFRSAIADVDGERTDRFLLRWLRAREFDVSKAEDMFRQDVEWRSKNGMSSILEDYQPGELIQRYFPGGLLECHSKGHPLFLVPMGNVDIRGFLQILPAAAMLRHLAYMLECQERLKERVSLKMGRPVETTYVVLDYENFSLRQLYSWEVMTMFTDMLSVYEAHYPEILEKALVINAPSFFPLVWRIVRPFLSQRTVDKVLIFAKDGWREIMRDTFEPERLPKHWGGDMLGPDGDPRCTDKVCPGGQVPKCPQMGPDAFSQVISSRDAWELRVPVQQSQSLLRWNFNVQRGDLAFDLRYLQSKDDKKPEASDEPLTKPQRLTGQQEGSLRCDKPGTYVLRFDNSFSWLTSKNLTYTVEVQPPDETP